MIALMDDIAYLSRRERQERAAAKRAAASTARAIHQEMAELYATRIAKFLGQTPALRAA